MKCETNCEQSQIVQAFCWHFLKELTLKILFLLINIKGIQSIIRRTHEHTNPNCSTMNSFCVAHSIPPPSSQLLLFSPMRPFRFTAFFIVVIKGKNAVYIIRLPRRIEVMNAFNYSIYVRLVDARDYENNFFLRKKKNYHLFIKPNSLRIMFICLFVFMMCLSVCFISGNDGATTMMYLVITMKINTI